MNKNLIYKYLAGQVSQEETDYLFDWINKNEENEKFFIEQTNLWIWQNMPQKKALPEDYAEFREMLQRKKKTLFPLKSRNFFRFRWSAAALLLCLLALNLTFFYYNQKGPGNAGNVLTAENTGRTQSVVVKEFYTDKGVKARIILPDSSIVWLNSGTKISYPEEFGKTSREITFSGEAYFEVTPDSTCPMLIQNKGFQVRVLGTAFNLKNYENDSSAQITLYSGKVEVLRGEHGKEKITTLLPNETVILSPEQVPYKNRLADASSLSEWKEGKLSFLETPMPEVIKILERWHGVTFKIIDPQILDYKFTARFQSESIVQIMEFLKMAAFIDYSVSGNEITLTKR